VHDVAVFGVITQQVGNDFAECFGIQAFVYVAYGVMHVFLLAGNTA
jgi:hypothetical protein